MKWPNEANQHRWLSYIRAGVIIGVFAGPPCETWSRARVKGGVPCYSHGDGGPRLLRDMQHLDGYERLRIPEVRQLIIANRLLCFTIMVLIEILAQHLFMMTEHPAEPQAEGELWLASIWRLFMTRVIRDHPHAELVTLQQGHFGAKSPKPTNLLICGGAGFGAESILAKHRTCTVLPKQLEMGWDAKAREYATASLKSYPPGLCLAISAMTQCWMDKHFETAEDLGPLPPSFVSFTEELLKTFNLSVARGADYHSVAPAT